MVAVIEEKYEAGDARYLEFKVYRNPTDPDRVLSRSNSTIRASCSRLTAPWSSQARPRVLSSSGRAIGASRKALAAGAVRKGRPLGCSPNLAEDRTSIRV